MLRELVKVFVRFRINEPTSNDTEERHIAYSSTASVPEDYLFYTVIKGKRGKMSSGNVQCMINRYADMAREFCPGLPERVHPHMFRRTRATDLYQNGVALEMVSTFLGHAQPETTRIYARPSMEQMKTALESTAYPGGEEKALWEGDEDAMARLCGLR